MYLRSYTEDGAHLVEVPGRPAWGRPVGLGFCPFLSIFGALIHEIKTHPKLVGLVRNKQNMIGT